MIRFILAFRDQPQLYGGALVTQMPQERARCEDAGKNLVASCQRCGLKHELVI
jgi:hypothetical protein